MKSSAFLLLISLYGYTGRRIQSAVGTPPPSPTIIDGKTKGIKNDIYKLRPCETCFWPGERLLKNDLQRGVNWRSKQILQEAKDKEWIIDTGFKLYPNYTVRASWDGPRKINLREKKKFECREGIICIVHILWDGRESFAFGFSRTEISNQFLGILPNYPIWKRKYLKNGNILIEHRFTGSFRRDFFFNKVRAKSSGYIEIESRTLFVYSGSTKSVNSVYDIMLKSKGTEPELQFVSGLFDFEDSPLL